MFAPAFALVKCGLYEVSVGLSRWGMVHDVGKLMLMLSGACATELHLMGKFENGFLCSFVGPEVVALFFVFRFVF